MSLEYKELSKRIKAAKTMADLLKIERSCDRLWGAGFMTPSEFARLDEMLFRRKIQFD
jgi:hypothetical protein